MTLLAYARPNSAWQPMNRSLCIWVTRERILYATKFINTTHDYKNTMLNPKLQYNYSNINFIPELLLTYSVVVDGEFMLEWCEYFGQPKVRYPVPQIAVVHQLCTTAQAFDLRCESVTFNSYTMARSGLPNLYT